MTEQHEQRIAGGMRNAERSRRREEIAGVTDDYLP